MTNPEELERLRSELKESQRRRDEYLELALRTQSEFASYKRRIDRERAQDASTARSEAVVALLPLLDDLDRALQHLPTDLAEHAWARGVMLLGLQLQTALGKLGVERVGDVGEQFDPARHEAVAAEPRAGFEPGRVAEVVRTGYRASDRLLRPAQVVVAVEGAPASAHPVPESEREAAAEIEESAGPAPAPPERGAPGGFIDTRV